MSKPLSSYSQPKQKNFKVKTLDEAIAEFNRDNIKNDLDRAEKERQQILKRFPLNNWDKLTLDRYSLGIDDSDDHFCLWMEFKSKTLGGIGGGNSGKHIIYKSRETREWCYVPGNRYQNEKEAWQSIRDGFIEAFTLAKNEKWSEIDEIESISYGPMLKVKTLHVYFPDEILPIFSRAHLQHFLELLKRPEANDSTYDVIKYNRTLLAALKTHPALASWSTQELSRLLYFWSHPLKLKTIVKIAPGHDGRYWQECLDNGYICVGWDDVGDLSKYKSKKPFKEEFSRQYIDSLYKGNKSKTSEKGNELWTLMELNPGDIVVANKGISHILGVGTVIEPGYEFSTSRDKFQHIVHVEWDTSLAGSIPSQSDWGMRTVKILNPEQLESFFSESPNNETDEAITKEKNKLIDLPLNLILYGPPGTGKTFRLQDKFFSKFTDHGVGIPKEKYYEKVLRDIPWWQVIALVLLDIGEAKVAQIHAHEWLLAKDRMMNQKDPRPMIWAMLQTHCVDDCEFVKYGKRLQPQIFSKSKEGLWSVDKDLLQNDVPELFEVKQDLDSYSPVTEEVRRFRMITFHQSYSYEDFVEGIKPVVELQDDGSKEVTYEVVPGIFRQMVEAAIQDPENDYALFIDEINRANISKVLGELITLLEYNDNPEASKRKHWDAQKGEWIGGLTVQLPYSKESFFVPANLHVIGTMNTADRSIAFLDAALRRRFKFEEIGPDPTVIADEDAREFLTQLNERIEFFSDRDHRIGHSYFMDVNTWVNLRDVVVHDVYPLLNEYFFGDGEKLGLLLGASETQPSIIQKLKKDPAKLFGEMDGVDAYDERNTYMLNPAFKSASEGKIRPYFDFFKSPNVETE